MTYDKKTCRLESSTGYLKSLIAVYEDYPIYDHAIYLGINVTEKNFAEATKEEYEAYLKAKEEDKLHNEDKPS